MDANRIQRLIHHIKATNLSGVALNPGSTLTYLTGLHFHLMERPTVLLISAAGQIALVLPALEEAKLEHALSDLQAFTYRDDPASWPDAFKRAGQELELGEGEIGVEPTQLRFLELMYLQDALPRMTFVDASSSLADLRITKDQDEIAKMRQAAMIAQSALIETLRGVKPGMTEKAIANELIIQLLRAGSDPGLPFSPIVAIGENSANPHAVPTDRVLKPGDLLLVDWGASCDGYLSDITRTFTCGEVSPELKRIGGVVLAANAAGRAAGRPGLLAGEVDRAARSVIADAGYGDAFIHRTGHGLGLNAHEAPYIYDGNEQRLTPGMTFTVEPGIYLPLKGGVRIEDDVVVTEIGLESLTDMPREVRPLEDLRGA